MHALGPRENATRYLSSCLDSGPNHLSGLNVVGSGKMSLSRWMNVAELATVVYIA